MIGRARVGNLCSTFRQSYEDNSRDILVSLQLDKLSVEHTSGQFSRAAFLTVDRLVNDGEFGPAPPDFEQRVEEQMVAVSNSGSGPENEPVDEFTHIVQTDSDLQLLRHCAKDLRTAGMNGSAIDETATAIASEV